MSSGAAIIDLASFGVLILSAGAGAATEAGTAAAACFASDALPSAEAVIGIADDDDDDDEDGDADEEASALASGRNTAGAAADSALRDDGKSSNESSWPF